MTLTPTDIPAALKALREAHRKRKQSALFRDICDDGAIPLAEAQQALLREARDVFAEGYGASDIEGWHPD